MQKLEAGAVHISLPVTGEVLANRVRVVVTSGVVDLNALLRQATVRRNIVVELIAMHKSARQPGYNVDMEQVRQEALKLASTDSPVFPNGRLRMF